MLDPCGLESRERIGRMEWKVVAPLRPLAGAGPSRVVGDDGGVRLEGGDLVPDDACVDDVPGRHEQDGPLATAVAVPGDSRSVGAGRGAPGVRAGCRDRARG